MQLYDTARGAVAPLELDRDDSTTVRMYVCGLTPYDATHLGHAATYLTFDLLARRLVDMGHNVDGVRNITDVDDDILTRAAELGVHYLDLATEQLHIFDADMEALEVIDVWREPRATGAIPDIRGFIARLDDAGLCYSIDGTVLFDVAAYERSYGPFGALSGLDATELGRLVKEAESVGDDAVASRRGELDFALWKQSRLAEPAWDSRWGAGRPGWHIECSALARRELGDFVHVHGGGRDLLAPHHECALAQARAGDGVEVGHWVHRGLVHLDGQKMSKSLGNLVFVGDLRREHSVAAIRLALIAQHYREDWEWHPARLVDAAEMADRWCGAGDGTAALAETRAALDDDLDIPAAIEVIDAAARAGHGVRAASALLGVCPRGD